MSINTQEVEVSNIEYVGPHTTRGEFYEIIIALAEPSKTRRARLSLLFRPADAMFLARALQALPPNPTTEDHVLTDIARLQT